MKAPFVSLPNLLAKKEIVAERLQDDCQPEILADEMAKLLETDNAKLIAHFTELHQQIRCNADKQAADAVLELINDNASSIAFGDSEKNHDKNSTTLEKTGK